jgi:hypothetical protein
MNEIMKPIDERREFVKYWERKQKIEELFTKKDAVSILERRAIVRKERNERMLKQIRKP